VRADVSPQFGFCCLIGPIDGKTDRPACPHAISPISNSRRELPITMRLRPAGAVRLLTPASASPLRRSVERP
jgi:hypothetical protein